MRTIRVTGRGQLRIKPDTTRITMNLEGLWPEYGEALKHSSEDTDALKEVLSGFGFERTDLKTTYFSVDTEYESYKENDVYKQRFAGYRFRHTVKVEFESDNDRLGRILYALANCSVAPELHITYTVKDPETVKNTLIGKAVSDAVEKAAVLAEAGGVTLKDIQTIDYSRCEIILESQPMNRALKCMGAPGAGDSYDMDIEPDDIEASDSVTVVWEIE